MCTLKKNLCFFSRDERTHFLFRDSWHLAAQHCGARVRVVCRGFGWKNVPLSIYRFVKEFRNRRVVFGTSEVCLYAFFSRNRDIWVFTGLGRLLIDRGLTSQVVGSLLRFLYRGQTLIVLNEADRIVVQQVIGGIPTIIDGEGYRFHSLAETRPIRDDLTFAYVGRLLKSKGVDLLVASFARHSKSNWKLMLIGDRDFSNRDAVTVDEINNLAKSSQGKILSTGFRSDVRSLLLEVDVLVSLSRREGLPFSILDGIDTGTYLVLSPVPGHLSFAGLSGITLAEPSELDAFFEQISTNAESILTFDRVARLNFCKQKFGQEAIVESIKLFLCKQ